MSSRSSAGDSKCDSNSIDEKVSLGSLVITWANEVDVFSWLKSRGIAE